MMLNDLEMFWVYVQTRFESFIVWHGMMFELVAIWILVTLYVIVGIVLLAIIYFVVLGVKYKLGAR